MKQLTKKQAIAFFKNKTWEGWSDEQIVRFQLFQDRICVPFSCFHKSIEKVLNRNVYTHELGLNLNGIKEEYLGTKQSPTLEEIIKLIPEEKRITIGLN